ncbi:DRC9 protein, partial [Pseudoatta argentina]
MRADDQFSIAARSRHEESSHDEHVLSSSLLVSTVIQDPYDVAGTVRTRIECREVTAIRGSWWRGVRARTERREVTAIAVRGGMFRGRKASSYSDGNDESEGRTTGRREQPSFAAITTDTTLASPRHGIGRGGNAPSRRRLANTHAPRRRRWPPGRRKKQMEMSIGSKSAAGFSTVCEAVLEVLQECADSLAVYQNILQQSTIEDDDATNIFPNVKISETSILQTLARGAAEMTDSRREAAREKLLQDSLYVSSIIEDLKREISEHGTIDVLIKEIERITSQEEQEHLLIEENESMQIIVAELRKAIADKKIANEKEEERLTKKLTLTRDEKEKLKLIKDVEIKYVRVWEAARREQHVLRYELKMEELKKTLNDHCVRERNENHVNDVLMRYLTQRIAHIETRIEQWRQRYDREKKMYEKEIRKVRNEIGNAQKYLEELTTEYCNNQEFIDTYLAEQEALRRQKEHEDHVRHSIIKMQAWWRGVMVRRKLGPYRSEEKKKKSVKTKK